MTKYTTSGIKENIQDFIANPTRAHQYMLQLLERASDGEHIVVDPTNPFAFLLEASTALSAAAINKAESLTRRQYPTLADSYEDLYHHMADIDYKGRFASPARTTISLLLGLDEVKIKAVEENNAGVRRLTIPRYTKFSVANIPFTLLYPIDIRILKHGGLRITYDDDYPLEIKALETNLVNWSVISMDGKEWLKIDIPLLQLDLNRQIAQVNNLTGFRKEYRLSSKFYYCEAYNQVDGKWVRIRTTHSDKVYDPNVPTVCLKVLNNSLRADIPQIYLNNKSIKDAIRLDIYTTDGPLDMSLAGYSIGSFDAKWNSVPNTVISEYSAPLAAFNSITIYSTHNVEGGSGEISFTDLRNRIITRTTTSEGLPITKQQLKGRLRDLGFNLVTNIDDITDRQFIATTTINPPRNEEAISGMGVTVQTLETSLNLISTYPNVYRNIDRTTILPEQLYSLKDGILRIVPEQTQNEILSINDPDELTERVNSDQLLYTPYYYVIDHGGNVLDCRIYDLDAPELVTRFFFESNLTIGAKFDILDYNVYPNKTNTGYIVEVEADIGDTFKEFPAELLDIQLSFVGSRETKRNHISSKLLTPVDGDGRFAQETYIWQFEIETRYDLNKLDEMYIHPFYSPVKLEHEFDVVAVVKGYIPDSYRASDLDEIVKDAVLFGGEWIAVTQEKVVFKFGERLKRYYNRTRTVVDPDAIARREFDEPLTYQRDVYEYDETGTLVFEYDSSTQTIIPNLIHEAGDIVYDEFGQMKYRWRKGDIVVDERGDPIYKDNGRGLLREIDMVLYDAKYYFANAPTTEAYKREVVETINHWVNSDMVRLNEQLLERSEIFFHPTITKGNIKVRADNNKLVSVDTQQTFIITFFMVESKYNDAALCDSIKTAAIKTLYEGLQFDTVSKDSLLKRLREVIGEDIVSVDIEGFLHEQWRAATLIDPAQRLSYAKKLVAHSNGELSVEDDVEVKFLLHTS